MGRAETQAERARLQKLLEEYEAGRLVRKDEVGRGNSKPDITPDRAGNVRARIARLDELLGEPDDG
ncbi:MAG: hypothetical protein ACJ8F4_00700 [Sphingomonas sp.]